MQLAATFSPARSQWRRLPLGFKAPALAVTSLVLILVMILIAVRWTIRQQMLQGAAELQAASAVLRAPSALRDPSTRAVSETRLLAAWRHFRGARQELAAWQPLLSRLRWVPTMADRVDQGGAAIDAAYFSTAAAVHLANGLNPLWPAITGPSHRQSLLVRLLPALRRGEVDFAAAQTDANRAAQALARLPVHSGDKQLDKATHRLRRYLPTLRSAGIWLTLLPGLLGDGRPRRYLFAWENPAELRATGGFIGASDLITLRQGAISHRFAGRVPLGREIDSVYLPYPEAIYTPETYWIFCDSNWSPDFPLSARLERWFYGEDTGLWADGVIDFVDTAVPTLLQATGPLYVAQYHQWVTADNVTTLAQQHVNGGYLGRNLTGAQDTARKQFFNRVMHALAQRLQTLPSARWPALGDALGTMIAHRDLLLYSRDPAVEAAIQSAGADGRILRPTGDSLYIVDDNRSYNKINPYVAESAALDVRILPDRRLQNTLTLRYHVNPSPATLEGYGPGLGMWGSKHDYQDFLRVYVPAGARVEAMRGLDRWAPQPAYGLTQFAGRLLLRENRSATVIIRYIVPVTALAGSQPAYRLTLQRQPGATLPPVRVTVHSTAGLRPVPTRFTAWLPTDRDARLVVPLAGVSNPSPPRARVSSALTDPYIPYASFDDPHHPL